MSITWNGVSSDTIGVIVERIPNRYVPTRRFSPQQVAGRNGNILLVDKSFPNVEQEYEVYLSAEAQGLPSVARACAEWLMGPDGYCRLEDSYDTTVYREAFLMGGYDLENILNKFGRCTITFSCKPQKYLLTGDTPIEIPAGITTYTGDVVQFDGVTGASITSLSTTITPTQDLHGYANPWIDAEYDKVPYNFRAVSDTTASRVGNSELGSIVGGTVAWNQLVVEGKTLSRNFSARNGTLTAGTDYATYTASSASTAATVVTTTNKPKVLNSKFIVNFDIYPATSKNVRMWLVDYSANISILRPVTANKWNNVSGVLNVNSANNLREIQLQLNCTEVGEEDKLKNVSVYNLTQMFGSTIADYIYGLEQNTAGAGVAWFRKLFPKDYYAYDAGSLLSVKTTAHKEVGFNQFDKSTITNGKIYNAGGVEINGTNRFHSALIRVVPDTSYFFHVPYYSGIWQIVGFGIDKVGLNKRWNTSIVEGNQLLSIPSDCYYVAVNAEQGKEDEVCINLHWDGERDGEYEPYAANTYALDSSLTLRGIPKLDASNNLYYDGDGYAPDGTVTRRFGTISIASATDKYGTWDSDTGKGAYWYTTLAGLSLPGIKGLNTAFIKGFVFDSNVSENSAYTSPTIAIYANGIIRWVDPSHMADDKTTYNAYLANNPIVGVYELATPTTESAEPYTSPQSIDQYGTEEYVDAGVAAGTRDVAIPVGHYTNYANICPITGRTGLSVYVGPTTAQADATTYAVDWTSEAGTVYGGTLDVVTGLLTVTRKTLIADGTQTVSASQSNRFYITVSDAKVVNTSNQTTYAGVVCDRLPSKTWASLASRGIGCSPVYGAGVAFKNPDITTAADWNTYFTNNPTQFSYELATPITYQLTPQEIEVLVGENNVWTSSGPVSVTVEAPFVGTVTNPTPFEARPLLEVSGLGEITINGKSIQILEAVSDFQIDCETMEAEDNSKIYCMDFPELSGGENEIVGDGSITALTVTPRWWTL